MGGLCDFGVTQVPIGLGFGTALGLGLGLRGPDLGLGLDNLRQTNSIERTGLPGLDPVTQNPSCFSRISAHPITISTLRTLIREGKQTLK